MVKPSGVFGASPTRKVTTRSLPLARSNARTVPSGTVGWAQGSWHWYVPLVSGPSPAYQTTVWLTNPGLLPGAVVNVLPPPTGTISARGFESSVKSVPANQRPSEELVGVNQRSDRSTVAPPDGVHCMSDPDPAAHTNRSFATHVPPAAASP